MNSSSVNYFQYLPIELLWHIFKYLDVMSLGKCSQLCRRLNNISSDPAYYANLNLTIDKTDKGNKMLNFFINRRQVVKKLRIAALRSYGITEKVLEKSCSRLKTNFNRNNELLFYNYKGLDTVNKLVTVNLSYTWISEATLIQLLVYNPNLKHLNTDSTVNIQDCNQIIMVAARFTSLLTSWSANDNIFLTSFNTSVYKLPNLKKLSFRNCCLQNPKRFLKEIASSCSNLQILDLGGWKTETNQALAPIVCDLKLLKHLKLNCFSNITATFCEEVLKRLPKLQIFEIQNCDIEMLMVQKWMKEYPNVLIRNNSCLE